MAEAARGELQSGRAQPSSSAAATPQRSAWKIDELPVSSAYGSGRPVESTDQRIVPSGSW